jgi:hypothetical protein
MDVGYDRADRIYLPEDREQCEPGIKGSDSIKSGIFLISCYTGNSCRLELDSSYDCVLKLSIYRFNLIVTHTGISTYTDSETLAPLRSEIEEQTQEECDWRGL